MIRIVLESEAGVIVEVGQPSDESSLYRYDAVRFPLLSQIDDCSYACFAHSDMPSLLAELSRTAEFKESEFLREVYRLAVRCREKPGSVLTFTPFDE